VKVRGLVIGAVLGAILWSALLWLALAVAHTGIVGAFIDGAGQVPILVWIVIVFFGAVVFILAGVVNAEFINDAQREEIARAHRELRGTRGMPSTRTRSASTVRGGTSPRHPVFGNGATADGHGPVWRVRPRRDRNT
jgi:hypothetical protein